MRDKKLTNRRNDITQGWQFCTLNTALEKEREKKNSYNTGYSYFVTHPSTIPAETTKTLSRFGDPFIMLLIYEKRGCKSEFL